MVKNEPVEQYIRPESPDEIKIELIEAEEPSSSGQTNFSEMDMQQILPQETFSTHQSQIEEINNVS